MAGQLEQAAADFTEVLQRGTEQDRASIPGLLDSLAEGYANAGKFSEGDQVAQESVGTRSG